VVSAAKLPRRSQQPRRQVGRERARAIWVNGREVYVVGAPDDIDAGALRDYVARYVAAIPPLGATFRSDRYLRGETPYFTVSVFERPPIRMKPPYDIDYTRFWEPHRVLRLKREERHMVHEREEISVAYYGDEEYVYYKPPVEKVADTLFLFAEGLSKRDGVEVQSSLFDFIVPFDVFKAWLELEKSCSRIPPRAFARRMPAPLQGYLILHLNDEYQGIDMLRSPSPSIDDAFDSAFVALDPRTYESLKKTAERLDATSAFVEILKTAIKHADDLVLADISRLLNH
jgi:hypothetical protein